MSEPLQEPLRRIPAELVKAVRKLKFENPSDKKWALHALADKSPPTAATIQWLGDLVARDGARFVFQARDQPTEIPCAQ